MAGIYIHIPFCASRCIYCGFYSTTQHDLQQRYVDAICKEMQTRHDSAHYDTVYLGGGTPSQLPGNLLRQIFLYINKVYEVSPTAEVTIECNPDDVTDSFAQLLAELPVNRVSMGAQTFSDDRLRFLHRRHTAKQVSMAVKNLRQAGIQNISIDLMYGFPNETIDQWHRDIDAALSLQVEHLSAYCLMYEENTMLMKLKDEENQSMRNNRTGIDNRPLRYQPIDEETELQMYSDLIGRLTNAGFEHYEISNFARPTFRSRHNSSYWNGTPYIGLGAAAHSYDGRNRRQWNISDIKDYITGMESGMPVFDYEKLDADTMYNEQVMTALRTCEGLNLTTLSATHRQYCLLQAHRFLEDHLLTLTDNRLRLTHRGLFVSNMIMSGLMKTY